MKNKKILLTGGTGYLGSNIIKRFLKEECQIYIYVRNLIKANQLYSKEKNIKIINNLDDVDIQFDVIIHCATCYGRNGESAVEIYESNFFLPLELVRIAQKRKECIFINIDTILPKSINLYTLSKKQFSEYLKLESLGGFKRVNLILDQFYGPNDSNIKFPTYIIEKCLENKSEIKLTSGVQKRNFIYIDDLVDAIVTVLFKLFEGKGDFSFMSFHIGSDRNICLREFVDLVHRLTGSKSNLKFGAIPYREDELMESNLDLNTIKSFGWVPKVNLISGLQICIDEKKRRTEI